ncbi:MAG: FlgK family flagellar hook-associated protein, partial [Acetobacteraceae bacterium]
MSGLTSAVNAALSGIDAFEDGVQTVSTNISNETTDGYALRTLETETSAAGSGAAGSGVINPAAVQRAADGLAVARFNGATSATAAAGTLSAALSAVSGALQGNGDINGAASTFFGDLGTLASEPTNATQAATTMADAENLVAAFHAAASGLQSQSDGAVQSLQQSVASANQLLSQLAVINGKLRASPDDNSLLDQQQQALGSLSKLIGFRTVPLGAGAIEVTVNGVVLLDQSGVQPLSLAQPGPSSAPVLTVGAASVAVDPTSTSGSIGGGLAAFRAARDALSSTDWFAASLAGSVNKAQAEGLDGNGEQGGAIFAVPPPEVTAGASNTGSATLNVSVTNAADLPSNGSGYALSYNGTGWTATVPGTEVSYSLGAGPTLSPPGLAIAVSGTATAGDTFVVEPTPGAASSISLTATTPSVLATADPYVASTGVVSASGVVTDSNAGSEKELSGDVVAAPAAGATVIPAAYFGEPLTVTFTSSGAYDVVDAVWATVASGTWTNGTSVAIAYP